MLRQRCFTCSGSSSLPRDSQALQARPIQRVWNGVCVSRQQLRTARSAVIIHSINTHTAPGQVLAGAGRRRAEVDKPDARGLPRGRLRTWGAVGKRGREAVGGQRACKAACLFPQLCSSPYLGHPLEVLIGQLLAPLSTDAQRQGRHEQQSSDGPHACFGPSACRGRKRRRSTSGGGSGDGAAAAAGALAAARIAVPDRAARPAGL